jgi:hypothetical protein
MAVTWNANYKLTPLGQDSPTGADDEFRLLKDSIDQRMKNEHETFETDNSSGAEGDDFVHKAGSGKIYYQDEAPTLRPDGVTSLDSEDTGRLWMKSSTLQLLVWTGSAWVGGAAMPIGSIYVQLAGQATPTTLFGGTWENISSTYAGRFFRAEGGNAVAFSEASTTASNQADDNKPHTHTLGLDYGDLGAGSGLPLNRSKTPAGTWTFTSSTSGSTESRPVNSTMRIWKRIA